MTRITKASLTLAAALAIALGSMSIDAPAEAGSVVLKQGSNQTDTGTAPTTRGLKAASSNRAGKKDIWGDPDAFAAKCSEKGGGASTDEDGFPHCEDANGQNIPIPMEE